MERLQLWLLERDAEGTALRAFEEIRQSIDSLAVFPGRGRSTPYADRKELVQRFGRSAYLIQYRIYSDRVVVARIKHSRERR